MDKIKKTIKKSPLPVSLISAGITSIMYLMNVEISSKEVHQVAIFISTFISAILTYNQVRLNRKAVLDNFMKTINEEHKIQDSDNKNILFRISSIEENYEELKKITKYAKFSESLALEIKTKVKRLTSSANPELRKTLRLASKKAVYIITDMLKADFNGVTIREILDDFENAEDSVGKSIDYSLLDIYNIENYKDKTKRVQNTIFNSFATNIIAVIEDLENGDRQEPFRKACISFTEKIVNNAIEIHFEFKNKK